MNSLISNVITITTGSAGNSPQVFFLRPFVFFFPPSLPTFALLLSSLRMKPWGRSAWSLWAAYLVALVTFCNDPASAGTPLGPTGTSGLDGGVDRSLDASILRSKRSSAWAIMLLAQTQTPLQLSGGVITNRSAWARSATIVSRFSCKTD